MPRSTTISIRSAISSPAKFTSRDALPHWPSGAPSRRKCRLRVGVLRHAQTTCRYSDKAISPFRAGVSELSTRTGLPATR
jgi:hypothetical protein